MRLSPGIYGMYDNLAVNGHTEVEARSHGCYHLLALLARRCCIIDPGRLLTGGPTTARRGDRGVMSLQDWSQLTASLPLNRTSPEAGFRGGYMAKIWSISKLFRMEASIRMSGHTHGQWGNQKKNQKITINNGNGETTPLCWEKNKLTLTGWLEVTKRTKNLKMNGIINVKYNNKI